jgi:hypothetical protein
VDSFMNFLSLLEVEVSWEEGSGVRGRLESESGNAKNELRSGKGKARTPVW